MASLKIPYESLDPLTIGAADDESKIYREELELEVPDENLVAAIYPDEPAPVANATDAARDALGGEIELELNDEEVHVRVASRLADPAPASRSAGA